MKHHRIALVTGWMVVSLLAVAGFANFTAPQSGAPAETGVFTAAPDLGSDAGAVSALVFSYAVDGEVPIPSATAPAFATTTTTAPDTSERSATTFVRSAALTEAEVREIVMAVFPADSVGRAVRAAWCASAFNPEAISSGDGGFGLFQIPAERWSEYSTAASVEGSDILDPVANATVAAWMVQNLGWSSLGCS